VICIIAGSHQEAWVWARGKELDKDEWFYPSSIEDLYKRENFHVIVTGTAYAHADFELMYRIARERGKRNRKW